MLPSRAVAVLCCRHQAKSAAGQRPSRRRQSRAERNLPAAVTILPFLRL